MPSETERITNEVMDRHGLGRLVERLGRAYIEDGARRSHAGNDPLFANTRSMETAEAAHERPLDLP